jgi:hypothetical protein
VSEAEHGKIHDVLKASHRLGTLSMGTHGELRAAITMANNYLLRFLAKGSRHAIAPNMQDDEYRKDFAE